MSVRNRYNLRRTLTFRFFFLMLGLVSCDGEKFAKGIFWGMNKIAGEGFIPSSEIISLGEFSNAEVVVSKNYINGKRENQIELRLYDGKSENLLYNEENLARKCVEVYANGFSKIGDYDTIKILFIQTDPQNPENFAMSEYLFLVEDFL